MAENVSVPQALDASRLRWTCDTGALGISTTDDLENLDEVIGQGRVVEAIRFGVQMDYPGYNIYALGPSGFGRHSVVRHFLDEQARQKNTPQDWCYVTNFDDPHTPSRIALPPGRGPDLHDDMERFIEDCRATLTAAFEGEEYRTNRQVIEEELKERHEEALEEIEADANEHSIAMVRTPVGFALAPTKDGQVVSPEVFRAWPQEEREKVEKEMERIQAKLRDVLQQMPRWQKETLDKIRELNNETAMMAVGHLINSLKERYADLEQVTEYLDRVGQDVVRNVPAFLQGPGGQDNQPADDPFADNAAIFRRYRVNLLVDNSEAEHAPVLYEDNPTYDRLVGRIEHRAEMGALVTDHNMIRPGALHKANGGYLMLDVRNLLVNPMSWDGLKHALRAGEIRIEPLARAYGLLSTQILEPQPIPLDVKVVLVGERMLYYLLCELDPEFSSLFKVAADFEETIDHTPEQAQLYARLIATLVRHHKLMPFDASAVGKVLEHVVRLAGDTQKISTRIEKLSDLLREAHYHAQGNGHAAVTAQDVERAEEAQIYRSDRVQHLVLEQIRRGTILIDSAGAKPGQINGLAVYGLGGGFSFGKPSRITARIRLGRGEVVDIEREVALGGPIHSKGVLILAGYLSSHFAHEIPLSLSASLVFEQSYAGVEGDSASSAELYALLSAISEIPLRQDLAVTGSVNQVGEVQAIGGVNEKIEGFFDVCNARGLTGEQGVLIPASNVDHLMLHRRVLDAVEAGKFHIYPVKTIDEGLTLLTGIDAGARDASGKFPEGSVNARVEARLNELAELRRKFGVPAGGEPRNE